MRLAVSCSPLRESLWTKWQKVTEDRRAGALIARTRDAEWLEQAQQNRRRRRRRMLKLGAAGAAVAVVAVFLLQDGLRRSGLLDAVGYTCGEFIHPEENLSDQPRNTHFSSWAAFEEQLVENFEPGEGYEDPGELLSQMQEYAQALGMTPVSGAFLGWSITEQPFVASAVGEQLLVGHTSQAWSLVDSLMVVDPATGEALSYAAIRDSQRRDEDSPTRLLLGAGVVEDYMVIQVRAANGDTHAVRLGITGADDSECLRLPGVETEADQLGALPVVLRRVVDLSSTYQDAQLSIAHGREARPAPGSPDPGMSLSQIDVQQWEVLSTQEGLSDDQAVQELSRHVHTSSDSLDLDVAEAEVAFAGAVRSVRSLQQNQYLITWEHGYLVLARP